MKRKRLHGFTSHVLAEELDLVQKSTNVKRKAVFVVMITSVINLHKTIQEIENLTPDHCSRMIMSIRGVNRMFKEFKWYFDSEDMLHSWIEFRNQITEKEIKSSQSLNRVFS